MRRLDLRAVKPLKRQVLSRFDPVQFGCVSKLETQLGEQMSSRCIVSAEKSALIELHGSNRLVGELQLWAASGHYWRFIFYTGT